jgi:hypothetical protein
MKARVSCVAALLVVAAACGSTDRPAVAEWQPVWDAIVAGIPTAAELGQPPDRDRCNEGLGFLRSSQGSLFPTPDQAIDGAVREWVEIAEDAMFECPPASDAIPSMEFAYGQLDRLRAEVASVLAIDSP